MNADDVADFLKANPQFFDAHPGLLEAIYVPHPYGGRAIPLSERQILTLRDKARVLEAKLGELIQFGEENDAISEKVHRLAVALLGANNFGAIADTLYYHLREDFRVPHVALRVWGSSLLDGTLEGSPLSEAQRAQVETLGGPQCGAAEGSLFLPTFRDAAEHVRSIALVPLGATASFGLLALGSEDAKRFFAEMGTLYLRRIGELAAAALAAHL